MALDPLDLQGAVDKATNELVPALDKMLQARIAQLDAMIQPILDELTQLRAFLNGASLTLKGGVGEQQK